MKKTALKFLWWGLAIILTAEAGAWLSLWNQVGLLVLAPAIIIVGFLAGAIFWATTANLVSAIWEKPFAHLTIAGVSVPFFAGGILMPLQEGNDNCLILWPHEPTWAGFVALAFGVTVALFWAANPAHAWDGRAAIALGLAGAYALVGALGLAGALAAPVAMKGALIGCCSAFVTMVLLAARHRNLAGSSA